MAKPKGLTNSDLTPQQRRFAEALVANGGNRTQAAIAAGYSANGARVAGSRLAANPKVRQLLRSMTEDMIDQLSPMAADQLRKLLRNKSGYVRLEAAKDILNRAGIGTTKEQPKTAPLIVTISLDVPAQRAIPAMVIDHPGEAGGVEKRDPAGD